jgi:hypothetical protein
MQYRIVYKVGSENRVADALSRRRHEQPQLLAISVGVPQWLDEVVACYDTDVHTSELIAKLILKADVVPNFTFQWGPLKYKGRFWIANNLALQQKIMTALHSSPVGGHSGFPVTYKRIKQYFSWIGMKKQIQQFTTICTICQQAKPDRAKYPGLLQPLPVPMSA